MTNKDNETIIKNLLKYNIKYPLFVRGADNREYKINLLYTSANTIMMDVSTRGITNIEKVREFSLEFQRNLINKLKLFENDIWED